MHNRQKALCCVAGLVFAAGSLPAMAANVPEPAAVSPTPEAKAPEPKKNEAAPGWFAVPGTNTSFKLTGSAQVNLNYDVGAANDDIVSFNGLTLRNDPAYQNTGHFGANARESRFGLLTSTKYDDRTALKTMLEIDFYENPAGNPIKELVLNSFAPRIRHAFGEASFGSSKILFGQTWTTFMEVGALSERLDQGSPGGSHFMRQAQVRYTLELDKSNLVSVAVENPQSAAVGATKGQWKNRLPDFVAKWKGGGGWGFVSLAVVVRDISVNDNAAMKGDVVGLGVGVDGRVRTFGKDNLTFQLGGGPGIGRYIKELDGQDATWTGTELKATMAYGGAVAYQHHWAEQWRSNLIYAYAHVNNESTATDQNKTLQAAFVNVIYSPLTNFDIGLQYTWAKLEIEDGTSGVAARVATSFKYSF